MLNLDQRGSADEDAGVGSCSWASKLVGSVHQTAEVSLERTIRGHALRGCVPGWRSTREAAKGREGRKKKDWLYISGMNIRPPTERSPPWLLMMEDEEACDILSVSFKNTYQ